MAAAVMRIASPVALLFASLVGCTQADLSRLAPSPDAALDATDAVAVVDAPVRSDLSAPLDAASPPDVVAAVDAPTPPRDVVAVDAVAPPVDVVRPADVFAPVDVVRPADVTAPDVVTPRAPRFTTFFSTRPASNAADTTVEDAIVDLIRRATPGSRIRVAIFSFTRRPPADALVAAQRRGVDVRVVFDGGADGLGSEVGTLRAGLGADRVTLCGAPGTSCNGSGIMHHKTFLFSALDDGSRNVVAQASHNLTTAQLSMHNNLVVARDDAALFAAYERTWNDLRLDADVANYYRVDDGDGPTRAYFFPRTDGDPVPAVLDNIACDRTSRVRVLMAYFTDARGAVAEALARRQRAGCAVEVVAGDAEIPLGSAVASTLRAAGVTLVQYPERSGWSVHSKYLLIDAPYAGSTGHRRLVFTGSHNWTGPALDANDETMLRVEDDGVFAAFTADWIRTRDAAGR